MLPKMLRRSGVKSSLSRAFASSRVEHKYKVADRLQNLKDEGTLTDILHPLVGTLTKITATIGPSTHSQPMIQECVTEGMRILRINCSHATPQEMQERVDWLRATSGVHGSASAHGSATNLRSILFDTKGPEIRTGKLRGGQKMQLEEGESIIMVGAGPDAPEPEEGVLQCTYLKLAEAVQVGQPILLDDGLIELTVESIEGQEVHCRIENPGLLGERRGVNIPGAKLDMPAMTELDKEHLKLAVHHDADYIAASFVRRAQDVREIRSYIGNCLDKSSYPSDHALPLIISKIESAEALENFDEILEESDGIMVARGDLGVEIPFSTVTRAQKEIVNRCITHGKPVIVATQMLESMIENPRPTRAEVSDVVNAVYDGADSVMLSGESAKGKYPTQSVSTIRRIIRQADATYHKWGGFKWDLVKNIPNGQEAIARSTVQAAEEMNASLIIVVTNTGETARLLSKYRGSTPIMAFVSKPKVGKQLNIFRGIHPIYEPIAEDEEASRDQYVLRPRQAVRKARELGFVKPGDTVVVVLSEEESAITGKTMTTRVATVK